MSPDHSETCICSVCRFPARVHEHRCDTCGPLYDQHDIATYLAGTAEQLATFLHERICFARASHDPSLGRCWALAREYTTTGKKP